MSMHGCTSEAARAPFEDGLVTSSRHRLGRFRVLLARQAFGRSLAASGSRRREARP